MMSLVLIINSLHLNDWLKINHEMHNKSYVHNKNHTNSTNAETRKEGQIKEISTNSSRPITKNKCQSTLKIIEEMEALFDEMNQKEMCCKYLNIKLKNGNCFENFDIKHVSFFIVNCGKYMITGSKCEIYNGVSLISKISLAIITSCVIILLLYILKSVNKLENMFYYLKV